MTDGLPAAYYTSDEQYFGECTAFDGPMWVAVCMADEVASHNDFVVRDVFGRQVVIQNMNGQIKAFLNVCPHRFNRVQTDPSGNRPLVCGYHGWEFGCDGVPCRIPKRPSFDGIDPSKYAMATYEVDVCGKLVFVCRIKAVELREWLGEAWPQVEAMTSACERRIDTNTMRLACNWKIAVENTLESYHVGHIHQDTFHRLGVVGGEMDFQGPHSSWKAPLSEKAAERMLHMNAVLDGRPYKPAGYEHQLVFPSCTIASAAGMSVSVQFFVPSGVSETSFISLVYAVDAGELSEAQSQQHELFNRSVVHFNRRVFVEDAGVCESTHAGAGDAGGGMYSVLSDDEGRVAHHIRCVLGACESLHSRSS
jgi:phenylpropionate dioxygenase-like ring-hydroxylating dioxygenase large terminal subunit